MLINRTRSANVSVKISIIPSKLPKVSIKKIYLDFAWLFASFNVKAAEPIGPNFFVATNIKKKFRENISNIMNLDFQYRAKIIG